MEREEEVSKNKDLTLVLDEHIFWGFALKTCISKGAIEEKKNYEKR